MGRLTLSEVSIRRPVLATVMSLTIVLFGIMGFRELGVREYPAVDPPVVTVRTNWRGANPETVDAQITEPLEQSISGIAGIRTMSSTSSEGESQIRVEFGLGEDIEAAANDVRDKVSQAVRRLPTDVEPPSVDKADADSSPIIFMAVQSDVRDILEVSNFADTVIKERIQTIPGVSQVRIFGEKRYAMRLWLDPARLAAHGVTPIDVQQALERQNVDLPSGRVEGVSTEMSVRTDGRLSTEEDFNNLIIREQGTRQIALSDVGHAELSAENLRSGNQSLGIPMIGVAVIPQPNTNAIEIADEFFRRLEKIKSELPEDFHLEIGYDFTRFVRKSIDEVQDTLLIAFGLVVLIIYAFLRDWRSVLIPVIAIPVSIINGFFIMYVMGFSINILTLVALVLSIGLVVDDAIVVLENIYTKIEEGKKPFTAAVEGSREIYFAVISTTVALASVFVPVIFLQGLSGRLFREFGIVVVGCVLTSSFVALSLSPSLCRLLLRPGAQHGLLYRLTEPFYAALNSLYRWSLSWFLRVRLLSVPILGALVVGTIVIGASLSTELAPLEDRSNMRLNLLAPEGATYEHMVGEVDRVARWLESRFDDEIHRVFAITGRGNAANSAFVNVYLKEPEERRRSAFAIFDEVSAGLPAFSGVRASPSMPPTIGDRRGGLPVQFVLQAPNLQAMQETLPRFLEAANDHPSLRFVDADLKTNRPQANIRINRARASDLGVSILDVARTLQLALGDARYGDFLHNGKQYDVIGQLQRTDRDEPGDLDRLYIRARGGDLVPLASVLTVSETVSPSSIYRFDRFISATVSGGLAPGLTLGEGIAAMREVARDVLPDTFTTTLSGQSRDFEESSSSLLTAFVLALVLIYLVLAAQFESWIDPFVIMITVPMSLVGAVLSLWITGESLNIFSQIGIIMLIGLVTKNGILIVEFANQRKATGLSPLEAVHGAAAARFRPILMTSLSTILGILPIAIAMGGASISRRALGVAVVGGLFLATFLSLYLVPAVYAMIVGETKHDEEVEEADAVARAAEEAILAVRSTAAHPHAPASRPATSSHGAPHAPADADDPGELVGPAPRRRHGTPD